MNPRLVALVDFSFLKACKTNSGTSPQNKQHMITQPQQERTDQVLLHNKTHTSQHYLKAPARKQTKTNPNTPHLEAIESNQIDQVLTVLNGTHFNKQRVSHKNTTTKLAVETNNPRINQSINQLTN